MDFTRQGQGEYPEHRSQHDNKKEAGHKVGKDAWWPVFMGGARLEIRPGVFRLEQYFERLGKS